MIEQVTIRRPDETKETFELTEDFITVEKSRDGKPAILMRLSPELVSTAPKAERNE